MKHRSLALFLFITLLIVKAVPAAAEQSLLYYILDGSGSMWGRVDGKMKIQIAKEVMSSLINETPEAIHSGLMVYGHRRKGDCSDIEEIIAPGLLDKKAALKSIRAISPKGMTPISDSITLAVEKVKSTEYTTTIVLVSDGIETCDKDPCAVTKSLSESGVNFVMHVVGFGVSGGAETQLRCIAEAGDGQYFSTSNAGELLSALNQIKESVVEQKPINAEPSPVKPTPQPSPVVQKISQTSQSIRIKAAGPGRIALKPASWVKTPYYWKLISLESGEEKAKFGDLGEQVVPAGDYQIVWRQNQHESSEVNLSEAVSIESGKTTELPLITGIRLALPTWVRAPYYWHIEDLSTNEVIANFNSLDPQLVPPGHYNLLWRQEQHSTITVKLSEVNIEAGKLNEPKIATAVNLVPADWVPEKPHFWALQDPKTSKTVATFSDRFEPQLVPPGRYEVIYRKDQHGASNSTLGEIEVREGEINDFAVNTGVRLIPQGETPPPYQVMFIELGGSENQQRTVRLSESFGPMPLKPGSYKITYRQTQHGGPAVTIVESFDLPAGNLVEIEL